MAQVRPAFVLKLIWWSVADSWMIMFCHLLSKPKGGETKPNVSFLLSIHCYLILAKRFYKYLTTVTSQICGNMHTSRNDPMVDKECTFRIRFDGSMLCLMRLYRVTPNNEDENAPRFNVGWSLTLQRSPFSAIQFLDPLSICCKLTNLCPWSHMH